MKKNVVLAYSGGMDSTVLLYKALAEYSEVHAVIFDYGQRHKKEIEYAEKSLQHVVIQSTSAAKLVYKKLDVSFLKDMLQSSSLLNDNIEVDNAKDIIGHPQSVQAVPWRNGIFLTILLGYAEDNKINSVWYGATEVDTVAGYYDSSPEFLEKINELAVINRKSKCKIKAPLITKSKAKIVKMGVDLGVKFENCWTCYKGKELSCGICSSCSLRLAGMIEAGYRDPLQYEIQDKLEKVYTDNECKSII